MKLARIDDESSFYVEAAKGLIHLLGIEERDVEVLVAAQK
jgi:hypothetical protein